APGHKAVLTPGQDRRGQPLPGKSGLLSLPALQGTTASGDSSPPRGSLEQLVRQSPAGPPLQGSELAVQPTPEASLKRLVPLVEAWKLLPNMSAWVLRTIEKGYAIQFGAPPPPFDSTAVVYYINHQGGLRSHPLYKLAHQILVWSQDKLLSLRAVHIPGHLNVGADVLSRQGPRPGEWMLHPEVVDGSLCHEGEHAISSSSPGAGCHGTDVAEAPSVRLSPDRSAPGSSGESTPGQGQPTTGSPVLAGPSMVLGPDISPRRLSMGDSRQEGSPLTGRGHHPSPPPRAVEAVGVASEGAQLIASGLSTEVVETILQSRAPSTRKLFTSWCGERQQDPAKCPVGTVLEFLQARFSTGLAHSTLKVYVAAISAYHAPLGGMPVGKDPLVVRFLRGVLRLRPPTRPLVPTWDLAVVLEALCRPPFEPIEEIPVRFLTIKTALLLALTSLKRVGDLQALSVAPSHLEFAPGMTKAFL
ncbi:hypothetical protein M9458_043804, partial [Cirrhinus mrigala]